MKPEVLFLDLDGPMFPDRYIRFAAENRSPYPGRFSMPDIVDYWKMDPMSVELLNFLYDLHPFTVVLSSSWKKFVNRAQCQDLFVTNGLNLKLIDDEKEWCTIRLDRGGNSNYRYGTGCVRAAEIAEYVIRHNVEEYIILDDPQSGSSLDDRDVNLDPARIVLVDPDVGIGSTDYMRMNYIVKTWAKIPQQPSAHLLWG
jgi:hypothetical protein